MTVPAGCPPVIDGHPQPAGPGSTASSPSTPAARTTAPTCWPRPSAPSSRLPGSTSFPAGRRARPRAAPADCRVGLDPARRREPRPRRPRGAARRGRRATRDADILGPKLREWPSLRAAARARRHDLRHRPPRDRARARRVRPGPARRRPRGARGQHRRHAGPPHGPRGSSAASTDQLPIFGNDIDFGWRAAAAGHTHADRPAGRGLPRRGRAPRHPAYAADRPAHALPGAPRGALHAAGQLPRRGRCRSRLVRLAFGTAAADARLPAGPVGRARRSTSWPRWSRSTPARASCSPPGAPDAATSVADHDRGTPPAGAVVAALPARARLRQRPRRRRDQPGRRRRRAPPGREARRAGEPRRARPRRRTTRTTSSARTPGCVARFLTNPVARRARPLFVVLALIGARDAFGSVVRRRAVAGPGRRRPTGGGCTSSRWHPLGQGTAVPAPAYVLPLALLATLLGGSPAPRSRRCCCSPCRSRCGVRGGSCASSAAWSTRAAPPRWLLALGRGRPTPWSRSSAAPGARAGSASSPSAAAAAVARARRARLRRPRAGPPLARRLADCALLLALGAGVRAAAVLVRASCSRWSWSAPAFAIAPRADARPLGLGTARRRARRWSRCCSPPGGSRRCSHGAGPGAAARRRPAAR